MSVGFCETSGRFRRLGQLLFLSAAFVLIAGSDTRANIIVPPTMVTIGASNELGSGTWSQPAPDGASESWTNVPIYASDHTTVIATIDHITVDNDTDPVAFVFFGVIAGGSATNFTISSGLVSFPAILNPNNATASASVTVTDTDANGASLTGQFGGPLSFQAQYNGGTVFTTLVGTATAAPTGTASVSAGPVVANILGNVSSIESIFKFTLSANDLGSGTGRFSVPEPSSICLAAAGAAGLAFFARRRRKA